jgi:hypothetical protein
MVTATGSRAESRRVEVPKILTRDQPAVPPPDRVYRYVTNEARFYHVKVVTLDGEDRVALREKLDDRAELNEDEAMTWACLGALGHDYVRFHDYAFGTEQQRVASWLDDRIRRGSLLGVARDSQQMRVRCAYQDEEGKPCQFQVFNTKHGLEEMARHILEDHDTYDDEPADELILPPLQGLSEPDDEEPRSTADEPADGE